MREHTQPEARVVHGVQRRDILFGGMGAYYLSSPVRSSERGKRVVSPAGRITDRSPRNSRNYRVAQSQYGRIRWIASTSGLAVATVAVIVHHVFGG